jgi:hypothetical protein
MPEAEEAMTYAEPTVFVLPTSVFLRPQTHRVDLEGYPDLAHPFDRVPGVVDFDEETA